MAMSSLHRPRVRQLICDGGGISLPPPVALLLRPQSPPPPLPTGPPPACRPPQDPPPPRTDDAELAHDWVHAAGEESQVLPTHEHARRVLQRWQRHQALLPPQLFLWRRGGCEREGMGDGRDACAGGGSTLARVSWGMQPGLGKHATHVAVVKVVVVQVRQLFLPAWLCQLLETAQLCKLKSLHGEGNIWPFKGSGLQAGAWHGIRIVGMPSSGTPPGPPPPSTHARAHRVKLVRVFGVSDQNNVQPQGHERALDVIPPLSGFRRQAVQRRQAPQRRLPAADRVRGQAWVPLNRGKRKG